MARSTEILLLDAPFERAWAVCNRVLSLGGWNISGVQNNTFFVRERLGLVDVFFRNPCRFALMVERTDDETRTAIRLMGSTLGFGPLPKGRLRRLTELLKSQLLVELERPET
jgi:hypothetical protein